MRYHFYTDNKKKVICVTTFGKKPVKGVAVCADEDTFDLETGKKLAQARADVAWAKKRVKYAEEREREFYHIASYWIDEAFDAKKYLEDCYEDLDYYNGELEEVKKEVGI